MSKIIKQLLGRIEKQDSFSVKAARALLDQAMNNSSKLTHAVGRLSPFFQSSNLDLRAVIAGIFGYINSKEALDILLEEIEITPWDVLSSTTRQSEGLSDEPLYYWYTSSLAESLGGNEPSIYGLRLLEYLICDIHTRPEVRAQAMTAIYYAIGSIESYRMTKDATNIVLQLSDSEDGVLADASLQLLGEINDCEESFDTIEDGVFDDGLDKIHKKAGGRAQVPSIATATAEEVLKNVKPHFGNQFLSLNGHEFERFMKHVFERMGYKVVMTPGSNDFGADLIIKKGDENTAVQLKRYGERQKVGNAAVGAIVGAKAHYKCTKAMVITTARYTRQAVKLAHSNKVELWDWDQLSNVIKGSLKA